MTVEAYNSACTNAYNRYTTQFIIRTVSGRRTLVQSVLSSIASYRYDTVYYYR